jgi:arylsulfatase A-like enzyme
VGRHLMTQNRDDVLARGDAPPRAPPPLIVDESGNGDERFSDVWPFIGEKGELLQGGLRGPMIVRWPGRIAPGSVSDQAMASRKRMPTLLAAAGSGPDPTCPPDGEDLLPVLTGRAQARPRRLFWRCKAHDRRAVRDGN